MKLVTEFQSIHPVYISWKSKAFVLEIFIVESANESVREGNEWG